MDKKGNAKRDIFYAPGLPEFPIEDSLFRINSLVGQRYVDRLDLDRWEQQRQARKRRRVILDPYRYED